MSKTIKTNSPHAAALANPLFRKRIKPSGKTYKRKEGQHVPPLAWANANRLTPL
jgi:stalled ribosome alternative rescue factor ArfA